jgi:prolipoprotein diacylglyceryl transferase
MVWDVDPEIFRIGFVAVRYYSLMFIISFMTGIYLFKWIYRIENKPVEDIDNLFMYMLLGTIFGARLGHCLFYDPAYYLSNPFAILKVWEGGLASHGAAVGILISLRLYSKKRPHQPYLWLVDRIVITVAFAGGLIRLGNLFNSEIIGKATDVPWAIILKRVDMIPRHPTQVYESLAYLLIFFFLFYLYKKTKEQTARGVLLGWFLILVFGFRFFVEFYKESQVGFEQGMSLNMGQILSIPAVLAGLVFVARSKVPNEEQLTKERYIVKKKKLK